MKFAKLLKTAPFYLFNDIVARHFLLPWIAEIAHCMKAVYNVWINGLYLDCENEK